MRNQRSGRAVSDVVANTVIELTTFTDNEVPFTGIRLYIDTSKLSDEAFQVIGASETIEVEWDAAELHDLSAGGDFDIFASGSFQYAEEGSNKVVGKVIYDSNVVTAKVDGVQAAQAHTAYKAAVQKRIVVNGDCSSSRKEVVRTALGVARSYAQRATTGANAGMKLQEYFKSTSSSTKSTVATVFDKIANQIVNSSNSGAQQLYCTDVGKACSNGVVAYTQPGSNEFIALCDYWFQFPAKNTACHDADQPYVLIHEATHLVAVKGTDDICYGYNGCVTAISASQALNNADTYALYSNALQANC